jgi:8-oxo-dGTP diphosphatase
MDLRGEKRAIRVVAAVLEKDGCYLITQRRESAVLPLLWEFPGGRVEDHEEDAEALRRELFHRLNVEISVGSLISFISHPYDHYMVDLYLYSCELTRGPLQAKNVHAFRWVCSDEFDHVPFTPADQASMNQLLSLT